MEESDEIQKLINETNFKKTNSKNYEKMNAKEISKELRTIMKFEQEAHKKIEEFGKTHENQDLVEYAKMISRNTTAREITELQETYLKKIDEEYLK
ncbi:MAG: hypothetical protein OEW78_05345 [Nitrosopumilus sp.]|uniref:hypothetical protein n=1 Tax=Nitrosopumilus sp. TaxID=2024843 RepID=UPI00246E6B8A|nr:hypothetical protein [Nitrosopumilus sp.]MDH5431293.1 hypothetical protein [Nitrosopumilus sp.]MDH5665779.1 hypothetical protein [Nitrosopumilus sp.]MDH5697435.1 hypothetical protein [Nitrosopumilus sp.]